MSRTAFGFPKILWNIAKHGMLKHGPKSIIRGDGRWHEEEKRLREGDIIELIVRHRRGDSHTTVSEAWRAESVESLGDFADFYGRTHYRIKFRRME